MVEAVVALTIFAVFATGGCKLLMSHRRVMDMARSHYTAINLAKNRMELVRRFDFDQVSNFIENNVIVDASGVPAATGNYRRSTAISTLSANLVEITVTIEIRNRQTLKFNPSEQQLSCYFAKYLEPGGGTSPPPPS